MRRLITPSWYREKRLLITHVLLAVGVVLALAGNYRTSQDTQKLAGNTHRALCALRAGIVDDRDRGVAFLKEHPNGVTFQDGNGKTVRITGIQLQQTIDQQTSRIQALNIADCVVTPT